MCAICPERFENILNVYRRKCFQNNITKIQYLLLFNNPIVTFVLDTYTEITKYNKVILNIIIPV